MSKIKWNPSWLHTAIYILWISLTLPPSANGQDNNSSYHDNTTPQNSNPDQALLHSILGSLASLDQRLNTIEQRINSLEQNMGQRFTSLEQRFDNLDQQINQLASSGSSFGGSSEITTPKSNESTTSAEQAYGVTFRFLRVIKTVQEHSYKVRIEYDGPPVPKVMYSVQLISPARQVVTNPQENGFIEVVISKDDLLHDGNCNGKYWYDETRFDFIYPDNWHSITVFLNGSGETMEVPQATFQMTPVARNGVTVNGNDVIFKSGSKLLFDIKFNIKNETEYDTYSKDIFYIKSETEEDTVIRTNSWDVEGLARLDPVEGFDSDSRWTKTGRVQLNSTKEDLEGILQYVVNVEFHCRGTPCLVKKLMLHYFARFYREDHLGPFGSEDFIGFVRDDYTSNKVLCRKQDACFAGCQVECETIGGNDVRTNIIPMTAITNSHLHTTATPDYAHSTLTLLEVTSDAEGDYVCQATNRNGVNKTRVMNVVIITEAKIDLERSNVTKFENGSVLVTCVAEGNPAPNVTFQYISSLEPSDYVITYTDLNETTRKADLFVADLEAVERFWALSCVARGDNHFGGDSWTTSAKY